MKPGPSLEALSRRLAECPAELSRAPGGGPDGTDVEAVVSDLLRDLEWGRGAAEALAVAPVQRLFDAQPLGESTRRLVLIASWLLHDDWFIERGGFAEQAHIFLKSRGLAELAELVRAERFIRDADRREELIRVALGALELVPAGEAEHAALDRLTALSSVERKRVLDATRTAREHAEKVRRAMEEKLAAESAARYSRE
jgi:hypothetical protein